MEAYYRMLGPSGEINFARGRMCAPSAWELESLWVWSSCRKRGIGRELLRMVCADADEENLYVRLSVSAHRSGFMDNDMLAQWYARYGFQEVTSLTMERIPNFRLPVDQG